MIRPSWSTLTPGRWHDSCPCFTSSQIPDKSWPLSCLQRDKDMPSAPSLGPHPCQGRKTGPNSHLMRTALTHRDPSSPGTDIHHHNPQDRLTGTTEQTDGGRPRELLLGKALSWAMPPGILMNVSQTLPVPQDLGKHTRIPPRPPPAAQRSMRSHPRAVKKKLGAEVKTGVCGRLGSGDRTRRQKITRRAISWGVRGGIRGRRLEGQAEGSRALRLSQTPLGLGSRNEPSALL